MVNAGVTFKVGMHSYVTPTNNSDMTLMEKVKKLEQAIIAKKMAVNYKRFGGRKISTL